MYCVLDPYKNSNPLGFRTPSNKEIYNTMINNTPKINKKTISLGKSSKFNNFSGRSSKISKTQPLFSSSMLQNLERNKTSINNTSGDEETWSKLFYQWKELIRSSQNEYIDCNKVELGSLNIELEDVQNEYKINYGDLINFAILSDCTHGVTESGEVIGRLPAHTHRWLSLLLLNGYIQCRSQVEKSILGHIILMISVAISADFFPSFDSWTTMNEEYRYAWGELSSAFGITSDGIDGFNTGSLGLSSSLRWRKVKSQQVPVDDPKMYVPEGRSCSYDLENLENIHNLINGFFEDFELPENNVVQPSEKLKTELRQYQLEALGWMIHREKDIDQSSTRLPQYWHEYKTSEGKVYYYNEVTKQTSWTFPYEQWAQEIDKNSGFKDSELRLCGGILADDMGMGKTIQMISLIATNDHTKVNSNGYSKTTLIVTPLSVLKQWNQEIEKHTYPDSLSVYVYHGNNRTRSKEFLENFDIVLTTYSTLSSEYNLNMKGNGEKNCGILTNIKWFRVILDEAHTIKDKKTRTAKAATSLISRSRWAVTGTPIQNNLKELFSLFSFLKIIPFGERVWWDNVILKPIKNKEIKGITRLKKIIQKILLRRTKDQTQLSSHGLKVPVLQLPEKIIKVKKLTFDENEREYYDSLWNLGKAQFSKFLSSEDGKNSYFHILELLLRLRQCCNHMELSTLSKQRKGLEWNDIKLEFNHPSQNESGPSPSNFQSIANNSLRQSSDMILGIEAAPIDYLFSDNDFSDQSTSESVNNVYFQKSTKIKALFEEIHMIFQNDNESKIIIFSQWTTMLDIIEMFLNEEDIMFSRLDGTMSSKQREISINKFKNDPSTRIFLISIKAGGLGINLTMANHVIILDPWWSSAPEEQAIDRVHRIGQTKPVYVTKFVIGGTIEERVIEIQEKKKGLEGLITGSDEKTICIEDLKYIFS